MSDALQQPASPAWRRHLVALFVTIHIGAVLLYALPRPPSLDERVLQHPEVQAEMAQSCRALHRFMPWYDSADDLQADVLAFARAYKKVTDGARRIIQPYLELAGGPQSWHMFGGTPPRFPLVFVVEVQAEGAEDYELFQDLRWGTADSSALNFRHRKVQENLSAWAGDEEWQAYATYWARRWDKEHPDRPAHRVRLSNIRLTTPSPEAVRNGDDDRHPEAGLQSFVWERPP